MNVTDAVETLKLWLMGRGHTLAMMDEAIRVLLAERERLEAQHKKNCAVIAKLRYDAALAQPEAAPVERLLSLLKEAGVRPCLCFVCSHQSSYGPCAQCGCKNEPEAAPKESKERKTIVHERGCSLHPCTCTPREAIQ